MKLQVIIINLKDSHERRASISKQLEHTQLNYSFLDATEGKSLTEEWIDANIGGKLKYEYINKTHFSINKNALACADSHRRAQIAASNFKDGYTVILEDDVELTSNFESKLKKVVSLMNKHSIHIAFAGYHLFNGTIKRATNISHTGYGYNFFRYPSDGWVNGAYCYIVDTIGASQLVHSNLEKIIDTADSYYINERGINDSTILVYPKLATVGYFDSDIGYSTKTSLKKELKSRIYFLTRKSSLLLKLAKIFKERRW